MECNMAVYPRFSSIQLHIDEKDPEDIRKGALRAGLPLNASLEDVRDAMVHYMQLRAQALRAELGSRQGQQK